MWIVASYEATALFSLKPANATASGGRTLLVPTPFAVKMALLDWACRLEGRVAAETACRWLTKAQVALRPARRVVVNNSFTKVLRPRRNPAVEGTADRGFFQRTINYREYAQLEGPFVLAVEVENEIEAEVLEPWLININYLGKRGGFIQIQAIPERLDKLPEAFIIIKASMDAFPINSILSQLDDTAGGLSFESLNIYSGKRLRVGKERLLHHVALPYRLVRSSRSYSYYEVQG
jgi:hypothetical protein